MMGRKEQIERLLAQQDKDIDTSDAPVLSDQTWSGAVRGEFYKPRKVQKTVRIDADVLQWLEHIGPGYQTRLNSILREAMLKDINGNQE